MFKKLWILIARLRGWKFDIPEGEHPEWHHAVLLAAPHTAAEDFFAGAAVLWKAGINVRFFVKKEYFNFFTSGFMKRCGCVPVDRGNVGNHLVEFAVNQFRNNEQFSLIITPEGTRKRVKRWKRGFYEIATQANVPIVLCYLNYETHHLGLGPTFYPTGDWDADIREIMKFYQDKVARYPELFNKEANL